MSRLAALAAAVLVAAAASAQEAPPPQPTPAPGASTPAAINSTQCGICHFKPEFKKVQPDGTVRPLFVDPEVLAKSIHAKWQCIDCHADVDKIPHPDELQTVNCQRCHFPGNPVGAPEDINYAGYVESVHGRLRLAGNTKAPLCQDCHGTHFILKASNPESTVNKLDVPHTCGRCHVQEYADFEQSIHGQQLLKNDNLDAPSCIDCHGEHDILPPKEQASEVSATHIPETCSQCHGDLEFSERYDIPVNPVKTFKHSFHGIANELGSQRVANCASCHNAHLVLPPDNPRSAVNPANIPATCGKPECHPGANANYARGRFHVDPSSPDSGLIYWVALFFKILTISTLVGLGIHILLDLVKKLRHRHEGATTGE